MLTILYLLIMYLLLIYWFYLYDICKVIWNSCRTVQGQFFLEVHFHHIFIFPVFLWKTNSLLNSLEILSNFSHSQNYHYPSLPFITITLNYHSLPLPFITITLHYHYPSLTLHFITITLHYHYPSLPLPFITITIHYHYHSLPLSTPFNFL